MDQFDVSDVMNTFSEQSQNWSKKNQFIWKKNGETRRLFKILKSYLKDEMRVLDIGSGQGKVVEFLCQIGNILEVFASDLSVSMLKFLYQSPLFEGKIKCFLTDAQNMCFNSNFFDIVTAQQVIHHLPRPVEAIHEIFRVLKPDGLAIILTVGTEYQNNIFPYQDQGFLADPLGRISLAELKLLINQTNLLLCEEWNDLFEMEFKNFENYYHFLESIGSLRKFYKYKLPPSDSKELIKKKLVSQGILIEDTNFSVRGHYITVLLRKPPNKHVSAT